MLLTLILSVKMVALFADNAQDTGGDEGGARPTKSLVGPLYIRVHMHINSIHRTGVEGIGIIAYKEIPRAPLHVSDCTPVKWIV